MTAVLHQPWTTPPAPAAQQRSRLLSWAQLHRQSLAIGAALLAVCGVLHGINLNGWPERVGDDEGTYAAQAWAMLTKGEIAYYTYWYDHPFGGWLQIAAIFRISDVLNWTSTAVQASRDTMLVFHLISCGLVFLIARRLNLRRPLAVLAVLIFSLSPLALQYQRMAFLDNISTMWVLAAAAFALSPRRSLTSIVGAGASLAFAFWSKETSVLLAPGIIWMAWQNRDVRNWHYLRAAGLFVFAAIVAIWPLYALIKNELLPGPNHVSLTAAVQFQLFSRPSSGSLLTPGSGTRKLVDTWLAQDPFLMWGGLAAALLALAVRRLRPVAFLFLFQVAAMCRDGYLPYAYVTAMIPFAALSIAGAANALPWAALREGARLKRRTETAAVALAALLAGALVIADWAPQWEKAVTAHEERPSYQGEQWIMANVPRSATIIVDDNVWTDLVRNGYQQAVWLYKVDLDPTVRATLADGWRSVDYVAVGALDPDTLANSPQVAEALQHSHVVADYGPFKIYRVDQSS